MIRQEKLDDASRKEKETNKQLMNNIHRNW